MSRCSRYQCKGRFERFSGSSLRPSSKDHFEMSDERPLPPEVARVQHEVARIKQAVAKLQRDFSREAIRNRIARAVQIHVDAARAAAMRQRNRSRPQKRRARYDGQDSVVPANAPPLKKRRIIVPADMLIYVDPALMDKPTCFHYTNFREMFRIPLPLFHKILERARQAAGPDTWQDELSLVPQPGPPPTPLALKVLGVLKVLADGMLRASASLLGMSKTVLIRFMNRFVPWFVETFFKEEIRMPRTVEEVKKHSDIYARLGYPGCVLSHDGVHVPWGNCPYLARHRYTGKEGFPSVVFNVCVSHAWEIFSVTDGFPGATNDKTVVRFDAGITSLREDKLFTEFQYHLRGSGLMKGAYSICDGGYHRWPETICGYKYSGDLWEQRVSKRHESIRKDAEMTFGMMKQRFFILRNKILVKNEGQIDSIFKMCAILHNMILRFDKRDNLGVLDSDWISADLELDDVRIRRGAHSATPSSSTAFDDEDRRTTEVPPELDELEDELEDEEESPDFHERRGALLKHFRLQYQAGALQWLKHARELRPRVN